MDAIMCWARCRNARIQQSVSAKIVFGAIGINGVSARADARAGCAQGRGISSRFLARMAASVRRRSKSNFSRVTFIRVPRITAARMANGRNGRTGLRVPSRARVAPPTECGMLPRVQVIVASPQKASAQRPAFAKSACHACRTETASSTSGVAGAPARPAATVYLSARDRSSIMAWPMELGARGP